MAGERQINTRDIVLGLDRKVDELRSDMADIKVIAATVGVTVETLHDHEYRIRALEAAKAEGAGEQKYKRFLWPSIWGAVVAAAAWLPDVFRHHH